MDHHDGDLARLVGAEHHQVGPLERLPGPEQAGPAVAVQVGPRPHVGQRRGQVGLEGDHGRRLADGAVPHRVDQLEGALAQRRRTSTSGSRSREIGHQEGRQREGHLGRDRTAPAPASSGCSVSRTPIRGTPRPYWLRLVVRPETSKSEARISLSTSVGLPGRVRQADLEDLLVAVDLELDHPLGLDRVLRLGGADEPLEAGVVDLAGQRNRGSDGCGAGGELGVEQVVVGVGDGVEEAVDRLRLAPAVEPPPLDPRQLGQGVDQLGVGPARAIFSRLARAALTSLR